ncbi:MAG: nitrilase-related carbon-nitrogen hydrolase [Phycisphaerales bacterium JB064]
MRAHLVQLDIVWEDREANFARVGRLLDGVDVRAGDLVVLPEMFDSGFSLNTEVTADDGATAEWLAGLADDLGAVVMGGRTVGGCANGGCGKATNHCMVFAPGGDGGQPRLLCDYAKIHPFTYGRESEKFVGGRHVEAFRWQAGDDALTVCPTICYDLRFPELYRLGLAKGAEAFTCIANFPAARQSHWRTLAIARAIENQAFMLAVNRCGNDPHLAYAGGTIAVDAKGQVIGELGEEEGVLTVELDLAAFHDWRREFPAWKDGRLLKDAVAAESV